MRKLLILLGILTLIVPILFLGCGGDDGATGATGAAGAPGVPGPPGPPGEDATAAINPESCSVCHNGSAEANGDSHQAVYNDYSDASTLQLTIISVVSVFNAVDNNYDSTMTFTIAKNGAPYVDAAGLPSLEQKRFYTVTYDSATGTFDNSKSFGSIAPTATPGQYTATAADMSYAPEDSNGQAYGYIADELLYTEHEHAGVDSHVHLYNDVANAALAFGDVATYDSPANVAGCEKCHGTPYMKHGYRAAEVAGLSDFSACKSCHFDTRDGGHEDWQILVTDPVRFAEVHAGDPLTPAEEAQYAYKAKLMNDVHMAHAMEFPYPQSMANCATCHEGKLGDVLTDENFTAETCKSCHAVSGPGSETQAPSLQNIWEEKGLTFHAIGQTCNLCHSVAGGIKRFGEIHTGYDKHIYADAAGTKFSSAITVSIDNASFVGNTLTFGFSAAGTAGGLDAADIVPTVLVGLYGHDTKHFIQGPHESEPTGLQNQAASPRSLRALEYTVGSDSITGRNSPYIQVNGGNVTVDLSLPLWAGWIADGTVKKVEIAILPALEDAEGNTVALNAPSRTFDLGANAFADNYFSGPNAVVKVATGCNNCHDALSTTFHTSNRGRGGNIAVCKLCHITKSGGSHLEMQSRSIDSYVHAIHSFQAFDIGDIDFTDPVEAVKYELHIGHVYPNFTIFNCESCHNAGTYNVPDQSESLPGALSGSDTVAGRSIGTVPMYITGPATRACGACHRAQAIKFDEAGDLASLFSHWRTFGYLPKVVDTSNEEAEVLTVIDEIFLSL